MKTPTESTSWKDYLHFTTTERRGFFVLALLISLLLCWPVFRPLFFPPLSPPQEKLESLALQLPQENPLISRKDSLPRGDVFRQSDPEPVQLFPFDPNRLSYDSLLLLGIPPRTARTLVNFRNKGGFFQQAEDLLRVYGWRKADQQRLEAYMHFPQRKAFKKPFARKLSEEGNPTVVYVNRADEEAWQELHGIGPYYARRIVRFREALGGFYRIEQIAETYGLPDSVFQKIRPQLRLEEAVRPLKINRLSSSELAGHPYLSRREATALSAYLREHGPLEKVEDLYNIRALRRESLEKLKPYLDFSQGIPPAQDTIVEKNRTLGEGSG